MFFYSTGDRIKHRREQLGRSQQEVADHVGVSKSAVSKWETGEIERVGIDKIIRLSEILQIDPMDIVMSKDLTPTNTPNNYNTRAVPILRWELQSPALMDNRNIESHFYLDSEIRCDFGLKADGENSLPLAGSGSHSTICFFRISDSLRDGEMGAILYKGTLLIRSFQEIESHIILSDLNRVLDPIITNRTDVRILGRLKYSIYKWR